MRFESAMQKKDWISISILFAILFVLEVFVVHQFLTSQVAGANDFYSRWHGARALLLEGRNPYGLDVTEEIQPVIGIDPEQVGRGGFNYPLHVIFFFWPLVYLSYDWTQAVWWTVVLWLAIASTIVLLQWLDAKPKPRQLLTFLLVALTFYPITRSIFLGQFTIHVLFFLSLALLLLKNRRDFWAGIILSAASIKPQMLILVIPWLLIWAVTQKRWRFIQGLLLGGAVFLAASMALMPRWPLAFLEDTHRYRQFSGGYTSLELLVSYLWPKAPDLIWQTLATLLIVIMLGAWWKNWKDESGDTFSRALLWTIIVQILVTFQTGTTNQVLLLISLLVWINSARPPQWKIQPVMVAVALTWILTWVIFLMTFKENTESPIMFLPLPILALTLLSIQSLYRRRSETTPIGG